MLEGQPSVNTMEAESDVGGCLSTRLVLRQVDGTGGILAKLGQNQEFQLLRKACHEVSRRGRNPEYQANRVYR